MEYISLEYIFFVTFTLFIISFLFNLKQRNIIKDYQNNESSIVQNIFFDSITDLPNKNNIEIIITEHINSATRHNKSFYVLAIKALDYYNLKKDSNEKSDKLSVGIADAILSSIRDEDTTARVSEDEYIVVFNEYLEEKNHSIPIDRIKESLKNINVSYATCSYPKDADSTDSLIKSALTKL
ncbi:diguanylate cyclase [Sulfurimonas lithotrophica]|uniref:Diguanylate cyclase n=1 Tax=Sulfurimonas lithotrophica TaxID=2590022 RepID=A0A5P8P0L4_9BACT|nr:diguanylate cyclase [Sulfurimonas lithotrophica]QFR49252.1 diguanylate cyclase [Sulfurimonas lithotrophica]